MHETIHTAAPVSCRNLWKFSIMMAIWVQCCASMEKKKTEPPKYHFSWICTPFSPVQMNVILWNFIPKVVENFNMHPLWKLGANSWKGCNKFRQNQFMKKCILGNCACALKSVSACHLKEQWCQMVFWPFHFYYRSTGFWIFSIWFKSVFFHLAFKKICGVPIFWR